MTRLLWTAFALIVALVCTLAAFGINPVDGLRLLTEGALGDKFGVARTLVRTTPLLLCGLGMACAWRAGMFNVGGEGQYLLGGVLGAAAAKLAHGAPPLLVTVAVLLGSVLGGALPAVLAGWLQVRRGIQCVISTILMNFLCLQLLGWSVNGPLQEPKHQLPQSERLSEAVMFAKFDRQTDLHTGLFLVAAVAVCVGVVLSMTKFGLKVKAVGQNAEVARSCGFAPERVQMQAMGLSGGLCGLAAGVSLLGVVGQISESFSQGWGYLSIPVALLGGLTGMGVAASAGYFGALLAGGEGLTRLNSSGTTVVYVVQAVAVLVVVGFGRVRSGGKRVS